MLKGKNRTLLSFQLVNVMDFLNYNKYTYTRTKWVSDDLNYNII